MYSGQKSSINIMFGGQRSAFACKNLFVLETLTDSCTHVDHNHCCCILLVVVNYAKVFNVFFFNSFCLLLTVGSKF